MILGILSILIVIAVTFTVSISILRERYYPHSIAIMALGLVYSTTMLGTYVVGSDIQGELSASRHTLQYGWDFTTADIESITGINLTSVVTGFIAPTLSRLLHMDLVWIFKAIIPLFLVAVPVVMYYAFRKQMGARRAFYAALFFIIMPVYSLQISQIVKSMVAELFFALAMLAMVSSWRGRYKLAFVIACTVLAIISHYTIGLAMLAYITGILIVRLATSKMKWGLWALKQASVAGIVIVLLIGLMSFCTYYHYAYGGWINRIASSTLSLGYAKVAAQSMMNTITSAVAGPTITQIPVDTPASSGTPVTPNVVEIPATTPPPIAENRAYLYSQEYSVQVGIGLDFSGQPIEGKLFRIIQYLTQLLILVGAVRLLYKHREYKFTAEFVAGVGCSLVLLLICVFVPQFSYVINMPRFYQISLFFLAPMLILGCDAVSSIFDGYSANSEERVNGHTK